MLEPSPRLVHDCEAAEVAAIASWNAAMPQSVRDALGAGSTRVGSGLLVYATADVLMFNRVLGLGVGSPATPRDLDRATRRFVARGARRFMVQVAPYAQPDTLTEWLVARGFYRHNHWIRLVRDTSPPPPARTDLSVAELGVA